MSGGAASWIAEVNDNAKKAQDEGKTLTNENGVVTDASKGFEVTGHAWSQFNKGDKSMTESVSSIKVNPFTKSVLTEFKDQADTSERKIFLALVNQFAVKAAEAMEAGEELTVNGVIKRMGKK
tara:strand:- start:111 stop:479 length:369 start_codon:yes stop_codon:yes gene_type:complete